MIYKNGISGFEKFLWSFRIANVFSKGQIQHIICLNEACFIRNLDRLTQLVHRAHSKKDHKEKFQNLRQLMVINPNNHIFDGPEIINSLLIETHHNMQKTKIRIMSYLDQGRNMLAVHVTFKL